MPADASLPNDRRPRLKLTSLRAYGGAATILAGPALGILAWRFLHMGPVESVAIAFLLSAWLGPRMMQRLG